MNIIKALNLCKQGKKVRPILWRTCNRGHWIEARPHGNFTVFVEGGEMEEIPHAIRLSFEEEFLGEWEVVE